jgi:nucleolar protein 56
VFLITEWFGAFLLDDEGNVKDQRLFTKDAASLAQVLHQLADGKVLQEETDLAAIAAGEIKVREVRQQRLSGATHVDSAPTLADRAKELGYSSKLLHEATIELGRIGVRTAYSRHDMHVVQAVDAIDELTEQSNILVERLREWYGLHFPEFVDSQNRNEEVATLVSMHGQRDAIEKAAPQYSTVNSMGGPLTPSDEAAVRALAKSASTLYATRAELEKYVDEVMVEVAPNVAILLQPVLAARMLRQAGGLRRLATMPAGTIQTLGAEKALFRHIKEGKRPPKHGFLMQHPLVHRAPRHHRGALARSLAAKVALAARADMFTKSTGLGQKLSEQFAKRADELKDQQQRKKRTDKRSFGDKGERGSAPRGGKFESRGPPRGGGGRGGPGGPGGPRGSQGAWR